MESTANCMQGKLRLVPRSAPPRDDLEPPADWLAYHERFDAFEGLRPMKGGAS